MSEKDPLPSIDILDIDAEDLSKWLDQYYALKDLRKEHAYVADLIRLLLSRPNGLSRKMVLHDLERQRRRDGLPIPKNFDEAVQSSYNQHCIDSAVFKKRHLPDNEALFFSPGGKGSGRWAVNSDRALAWLKARVSEAGE